MKSSVYWKDISKYRNELFGLSIISIVIFHYCEGVVTDTQINNVIMNFAKYYNLLIGSVGVDIFLFLSGYGIYYSIKKSSTWLFYYKRLRRVVIPYCVIGIVFWFIKDLLLLEKPLIELILDFSLLSFWSNGVRTFWYISLICLLYLVSPLFRSGNNIAFFLTIIMSFFISVMLWHYQRVFYNNTEIALLRIPVYFLGMFCAKVSEEQKAVGIKQLVVLILFFPIICGLGVNVLPINRIVWSGYGVFLIVAFCCLRNYGKQKEQRIRSLEYIGSFSLELYLSHVAVRNLMSTMDFRLSSPNWYLLCLIISVPLAILLKRSSLMISFAHTNVRILRGLSSTNNPHKTL